MTRDTMPAPDADLDRYVLTVRGLLLTTDLPPHIVAIVCNAIELHMHRHYGPTPGITIEGGQMVFVKLQAVEQAQ